MIVAPPQNFEPWPDTRLKSEMEKGDVAAKTEALKALILAVGAGQKVTKDLLMTVIRFLIPEQDKHIKKLLLAFWELVPKYADGKLLPELILVVDAYRKDLLHPNEYVRGAILRFLGRLKVRMSTTATRNPRARTSSRAHLFRASKCLCA